MPEPATYAKCACNCSPVFESEASPQVLESYIVNVVCNSVCKDVTHFFPSSQCSLLSIIAKIIFIAKVVKGQTDS